MDSQPQLSPMSNYYIRRLLQEHRDVFLYFRHLLQGRQENYSQMLQDVSINKTTLSDPGESLNYLGLSDQERILKIQKLEVLVRSHQILAAGKQKSEDLKSIELEILTTLCIRNSNRWMTSQSLANELTNPDQISKNIAASKVFDILKTVLECAVAYLGPKIAKQYLVSTRPNLEGLNIFTFQENHSLSLNCSTSHILVSEELEGVRTWVKAYVIQCSQVIHGFGDTVNQDHLKLLAISLNDIKSEDSYKI